MNVSLSWPPRCLHPNGRPHWRTKAKAAKKSRADAYLLTKAAMARGRPMFRDGATVYVALVFRPPTKRKFDLDGALSANKAALDGIADALGVDDSRFALMLSRGSLIKGGAVDVVIHA